MSHRPAIAGAVVSADRGVQSQLPGGARKKRQPVIDLMSLRTSQSSFGRATPMAMKTSRPTIYISGRIFVQQCFEFGAVNRGSILAKVSRTLQQGSQRVKIGFVYCSIKVAQ